MAEIDEFRLTGDFKIWQPFKVSDFNERALVHKDETVVIGRPEFEYEWARVGPCWVKPTDDLAGSRVSYPMAGRVMDNPGEPDFYAYSWLEHPERGHLLYAVWELDDGRWVVVAPAFP